MQAGGGVRGRGAARGVLLLAIGLAAGRSALTATTAAAMPDVSFSATASGSSARAVEDAPTIVPLGLVVQAGTTTAQAELDSLGTSVGYAAVLDPGPSVVDAVGALPNVARSSYPDRPSADLGLPGQTARAASAEDRSQAEVATGTVGLLGQGGGTSCSAEVSVADDGTVVAMGESDTSGFSVAGVLAVGRVHATAKVTRSPDGELRKESSLGVQGLTVAGIGVTVSDKGVELAGIPLGLRLDDVTAILAAAGVTVREVKGSETETGVVADLFEITVAQDTPEGRTTTVISLGAASADIKAAPAVAAGPGPSPSAPPPVVAAPPLGAPPSTMAPLATESTAPPAAAPAPRASANPAFQLAGLFSSTQLYLVLVAVAGTTIGATTLLRTLGVRSAWT
jgi:hypothetical protein